MTKEYFQIKDKCREGLLKYLSEAFFQIPKTDNPKILDIGCGTGVPTIWIAENTNGIITAIDTSKTSLDWIKEKISMKNLDNQIITSNISFNDLKDNQDYYDIIVAEGFLNVIGFESGFPVIIDMLAHNGYFIIHDEYMDHERKCALINKYQSKIIGTLYLDENVWWNDYYRLLETEIKSIDNSQTKDLFIPDIKEIDLYKIDSSPFKSIYYIIKKL